MYVRSKKSVKPHKPVKWLCNNERYCIWKLKITLIAKIDGTSLKLVLLFYMQTEKHSYKTQASYVCNVYVKQFYTTKAIRKCDFCVF